MLVDDVGEDASEGETHVEESMEGGTPGLKSAVGKP